MRIIAGKYRSRKIEQPQGSQTRPTKDRIREAVFNIIAGEVAGAKVLDLFSGTGAYGLESISRGAESVVFIDSNIESINIIKKNVNVLACKDASQVVQTDVFEYLQTLSGKELFNLIFVDPPYGTGLAKKGLLMINEYDILMPSGLLIIEHSKDECFPEEAGNITILKQKTYKNTLISIFLKK